MNLSFRTTEPCDRSDWQKYDDQVFDELDEDPEDEDFLTLIDGGTKLNLAPARGERDRAGLGARGLETHRWKRDQADGGCYGNPSVLRAGAPDVSKCRLRGAGRVR
ncbi:MAG: hypothetical protein CME26_13325 [Gemmatimonadetes bacterium]|nr:hypothetical protein [Gemmatimonadota bacterium]